VRGHNTISNSDNYRMEVMLELEVILVVYPPSIREGQFFDMTAQRNFREWAVEDG
jgi:hypothetical protein